MSWSRGIVMERGFLGNILEINLPGRLVWLISLSKDILEITMPNRAVASCISFLAGTIISGFFEPLIAFFGMLMIVSTYSSQAIFNNLRDLEGDRVNAPERPLARGAISQETAWLLMGFLVILGFVFAYLASPFLILVNLAYILLGIFYSGFTKSKWYLSYSTLTTSHLVVPLLSGYLIFGHLDLKILMIVVFIYLTEIFAFSLKDYKDVEGDRKMGMSTLPIIFSPEKASRITFAGLILPLFFVWVPWYLLDLSNLFLAVYLFSGAMRFRFGESLLGNPSAPTAKNILNKFRYVLILQMIAWCLS